MQRTLPPALGQTTRTRLPDGWPEYGMEAATLGLFLFSACTFAVLLGFPGAFLHDAIPGDVPKRIAGGIAMGLTAIALIRSPWGQQSGAHMNPSVTLTFFALGRISPQRALGYVAGQFIGACLGVLLALLVLGAPLAQVNFAVTRPGQWGAGAAFCAEFAISFLMLSTVLWTANSRLLSPYTPYFAGALVALFIALEDPYSGMSMNPARSFASALAAGHWEGLWIYFTAPPLGALTAAALYRFGPWAGRVYCAKLDHHNSKPCPFLCEFRDLYAK